MTTSALADSQKPESFRFTLRGATRAEHTALDAHEALSSLMDGTLSREGYRRLMSLFHAFYNQHDVMLEKACELHKTDLGDFVYARRSSILAADLGELGVEARLLHKGQYTALPPIGSASTLAGYLYVFEGSMLGGGVLLKAAETMQRKREESGFGYWQWCRDKGAMRWRMTCNVIDKLAVNDSARTEIIEAARQAFSTFSKWLERWRFEAPLTSTSTAGILRC